MSRLVNPNAGVYYEPAAGTGGILITRWNQDRINDPIGLHSNKKILEKNPGISMFTYDPRNYWYQAEEMSDRAIPFLIFNMAIRGMLKKLILLEMIVIIGWALVKLLSYLTMRQFRKN